MADHVPLLRSHTRYTSPGETPWCLERSDRGFWRLVLLEKPEVAGPWVKTRLGALRKLRGLIRARSSRFRPA